MHAWHLPDVLGARRIPQFAQTRARPMRSTRLSPKTRLEAASLLGHLRSGEHKAIYEWVWTNRVAPTGGRSRPAYCCRATRLAVTVSAGPGRGKGMRRPHAKKTRPGNKGSSRREQRQDSGEGRRAKQSRPGEAGASSPRLSPGSLPFVPSRHALRPRSGPLVDEAGTLVCFDSVDATLSSRVSRTALEETPSETDSLTHCGQGARSIDRRRCGCAQPVLAAPQIRR
jgi:hypothetical protein